MNRRQALTVIAGAITAGLAGCGALTGPDPQVIDSEADADLLDAFASQAEVEVTVVNEGSVGDVAVYVEVYNEQDTLLEHSEKKFI
jgi:ABC-type glycerol-3-phosphate transport system substrate-binding protein